MIPSDQLQVAQSADRSGVWCITVSVPAACAHLFEAALLAHCQAVRREAGENGEAGQVAVEGLAAARPDEPALRVAIALAAAAARVRLPEVEIRPLPDCDWLAANRESFRPFRIGRFFIREDDDRTGAPAGTIPLAIDAGLAFGSGRHASTAGCLVALEDRGLFAAVGCPPRPGLDLGCGTGILAIAAARRWRRRMVAADLDPAAVAVARRNVQRNEVGRLVRTLRADATMHPSIFAGRPYSLILANILARPLKRMARSIAGVGGIGTVLILSGFVAADAAEVAAAYAGFGYRLRRRIERDGWTTLVLWRR